MASRDILDIIADYIATKDNAERHPEYFSEGEVDAQLNEIAAAFDSALNAR